MSDKSKPEITATIKFRGVTIEGMTIEELRQLRDVLNQLVGKEKEYVPYPQPYPVYPHWPTWTITAGNTGTYGTSKLTLDTTNAHSLRANDNHYFISCNN